MDTMKIEEIVGQLTVVQVNVACVSGAVTRDEDNRKSADVFTTGTVRYIDRKLLQPFTTWRQAAARLCLTSGTRFMGAWGIPDTKFAETKRGIEGIIAEFAAAKAALSVKLGSALSEWREAHPEVVAYASRFPGEQAILDGISISASACKVAGIHMEGITGTEHDGIRVAIKGLAGQILAEIAQDARDSFSPDATKASARARGVMDRIITKLDSLAFVDTSLASVADMLRDAMAALPSTGPLHGRDFAVYAGLMKALTEPETVIQTAATLASGTSVWDAFAPPAEPEQAEPAFGAIAVIGRPTAAPGEFSRPSAKVVPLPLPAKPSPRTEDLQKVSNWEGW